MPAVMARGAGSSLVIILEVIGFLEQHGEARGEEGHPGPEEDRHQEGEVHQEEVNQFTDRLLPANPSWRPLTPPLRNIIL